MKSLPNSEEGFAPTLICKIAKDFKVPGRIVKELFLGNSKKLSPGKYAVIDSNLVSKGKVSKLELKSAKKAAKYFGEPAPDTSIFMYIATPEEIAHS